MQYKAQCARQVRRCSWVPANDPLYCQYHDREWGVPVRDDAKLFEMLLLEAFQAGLSWRLVLGKREALREAFDGFDPRKIAAYEKDRVEALVGDARIIRNRAKIQAAVYNARAFLQICAQRGSFCEYLWDFAGGKPIVHIQGPIPKRTELSDALCADLKRRGMRFMGSVTLYSYLEAVGVVNNHEENCMRREEILRAYPQGVV